MSQNLYTEYETLETTEKSILVLFVLVYKPVEIYEISQIYKTIKPKNEAPLKMELFVSKLLKKAFLVKENYDTYKVNPDLLFQIFPGLVVKNEKLFEVIYQMTSISSIQIGSWSVRSNAHVISRNFIAGSFLNNAVYIAESKKFIEHNFEIFKSWLQKYIDFKDYHPVLLELSSRYLRLLLLNEHYNNILNTLPTKHEFALCETILKSKKYTDSDKANFSDILADIYFYEGNLDEAIKYIDKSLSPLTFIVLANIQVITGDYAKAAETITFVKKAEKSAASELEPEIDYWQYLFYYVSLIIDKTFNRTKEVTNLIKNLEKERNIENYIFISLLYKVQKNKQLAEDYLKRYLQSYSFVNPSMELFHVIVIQHIVGKSLRKAELVLSVELYKLFEKNNQLLLMRETAFLLSLYLKDGDYDKKFEQLDKKLRHPCLLKRIEYQEIWEESLDGLLNILTAGVKADKKAETNRIIYWCNFENMFVQPILQTLSAAGSWSKGRNIAMKRLKEKSVEGMTEQDNRIASSIKSSSSYYGANEFYFDYEKLFPELAGHPFLYLQANPDISVELVRSQPEITTEKTTKGYVLKINIPDTDKKIFIQKETNTRYLLIEMTDQVRNVAHIIGKGKLVIPEKGKDKLLNALGHMSRFVTIHSDLSDTSSTLKTVDADSRIRVQILPIGDTLKAEMFVKPFGVIPPYVKPAKGGQTIYGVIDNVKCQVIRDLDAENKHLVAMNSDLLRNTDSDFSEGAITFEEPYQCLALLETLQKHQEISVVEWPEGERFRVKKFASFKNMSLSVKGRGHWFEMEGELRVDEDTVLSLKQLLEMSRESKGRFIEMKKGEFLSLTEELKKRLDELNAFTSIDKSGVKINKFAAHSMDEIAQNAASFKTDKLWKDFQKKIKESEKLTFDVPSTLDAELRPYQEEGYRWMARLAQWNAGACLADDMGLGKTVQAIAILLNRAEIGPALVVCPASVVGNWINEIHKFAPTLNPINFRNTNRDDTFENLAPFDVLIITYGLLQSEEERMSKQEWSTAILDEAHAIKNNQTKSSKAAMNINAGFRLMLTGTPIQNHLGELWNLFNFCNPGLLGTIQQYNERFVNPVKEGNHFQKLHLKKLISPFILRRLKNTVLDELPPKTEITHTIELSKEEMAFYEALRRQAIENIEMSDAPQGTQHLKALAEITKLRLACCNSSLADKSVNLPSAKLEALFEIVDELLENKHRALIFSQFIGHLSIVREQLDKRKISYQYLDGSTPLPDREASVKAFQTGKTELFLISLKAGGLGLNLTAADYVIHLDPWWNPAIEDQASDRAHRIGQNRPVTIYRLVAKNTIEEKILQLHSTKRDLADSLLEGADQSAKLSTKDLLLLLKDV